MTATSGGSKMQNMKTPGPLLSSEPLQSNEKANVYTIRKGGQDIVESHLHNCGYSSKELKELSAGGFYLYKNGKKVTRNSTA